MNLTNAAASHDFASLRDFFLAPGAALEEEKEEADPGALSKAL